MNSVIRFKQLIHLLLVLIISSWLVSCASSGSSTPNQSQTEPTSTEAQQTAKQVEDVVPKTSVKNGKTLVIFPITFKPGISMNDVIRDECKLPEKLSGFVRDNALSQYENIIVEGTAGNRGADVLSIQIVKLLAPKGGGWSGPKFVSIEGTLKRNGRKIGSFTGKRTSMGGAFGVFKGTCDILGRCTKTLGADIVAWLQNPLKNSSLGN